jgi:hypothetical protein
LVRRLSAPISAGSARGPKKNTDGVKIVVDAAARLSTTPSTPTGGTPEAEKTAVTKEID